MKEPALGLLELKSIAKGMIVADAVVKKAPVNLLASNPICPGKYMIILAGEVSDVEESLKAGVAAGGDLLINDLFLPSIHGDIIPAISGTIAIKSFAALGIVEYFSIASCIIGADLAAKATDAKLVTIRLANGLGGKAYFVMTGELADVEASIYTAKIKKDGMLAGCEIIASPHPDLIEKGVYW